MLSWVGVIVCSLISYNQRTSQKLNRHSPVLTTLKPCGSFWRSVRSLNPRFTCSSSISRGSQQRVYLKYLMQVWNSEKANRYYQSVIWRRKSQEVHRDRILEEFQSLVRQGCILSPALFPTVIGNIFRATLSEDDESFNGPWYLTSNTSTMLMRSASFLTESLVEHCRHWSISAAKKHCFCLQRRELGVIGDINRSVFADLSKFQESCVNALSVLVLNGSNRHCRHFKPTPTFVCVILSK